MARAQSHLQSFAWFLCLVVVAAASWLAQPLRAHDFAESVVKIRAVGAEGSETFGSAVVIAPDLLATACHVTRDARVIEVTQGAERWLTAAQSGSLTHDLCLITVPHLGLATVPIRDTQSLRPGERVVAAGFASGRDLVTQHGIVEGLYPHDGGKVIRTSAAFDMGSSGGGLFDAEGALVGLLAFKARYGERLYFALPADWAVPGTMVSAMLGPLAYSSERIAFWERPKATQPSFLRNALLEATSQR